ncbi:hypothetical protein KWH04_21965 [Xanthomonas campestris pv. trichodesmae]|nr:hypothetical protein [Xanthomonas citri]MBV6783234.1 hypothetical protein [Xanthomonas campestris pv. trichodesmae]
MLITLVNICNFTMLLSAHQATNKDGKAVLLTVNKESPLTHYMVCTANRLKIDEQSITNGDNQITFQLREQISDDTWETHEISLPAVMNGAKASLSLDRVNVVLSAESKPNLVFDNAFSFMATMAEIIGAPDAISDFLKLKCLYVGQTELRTDYIRLQGHEKVQQALAEAVHYEPHREVFVKLLSFQDPFCNALSIPEVASELRVDWLPGGELLNNLPKAQLANLIEGALINYFKPILNVKLKHNFPSSRHSSYGYFYEREVRSVVVELHEEYRAYVTCSEIAPPRKIFFIEYKLNKDASGAFIQNNSIQDLDRIVLGRKA